MLDESSFSSSVPTDYCFSQYPLPSSLHCCANTSSLTNNSTSLLQHLPFLSHLIVHHLSSCHISLLAKQSRLLFSPSQTRASTPFSLIHLDLWGPYRHCSSSGAQYMLTIVDDYSRATWTYFMLSLKPFQSLPHSSIWFLLNFILTSRLSVLIMVLNLPIPPFHHSLLTMAFYINVVVSTLPNKIG